jgi:phosphoglycolate phosphatase-like HAD superfamily hydrolase
MSDPTRVLKDMKPEHEFFVGIDSDGCIFDTMEIKHKECFCPNFVYHYNLQPVSKYAREAWDFVNLYSKSRGCNRFHAVTSALELLERRAEVKARGAKIPRLQGIRDWCKRETKLGNPVLKAEMEKTGDPDLKMAYAWSIDVNATIEKVVKNVPPFPLVRESLEKMKSKADMLVVSQTPTEALVREWEEHHIDKYPRAIAGQELGTKTEHIAMAATGKYAAEKMLMIGDAPGDYQAAKKNNALFFPIIPGLEEQSWKRFYDEAMDRFFKGTYAGAYEKKLIEEFDKYLPEHPAWEKK